MHLIRTMQNEGNGLHHVYLLVGGNIGNRQANIDKAKELIVKKIGAIQKASSLYETAAWGMEDQPDFLNQALLVNTHLAPLNLLDELLAIEREMGRIRNEKFGPRIVDIDILLYNNRIIDHHDLIIPHPRMAQRRFVLEPLAEIAANMKHPLNSYTIGEMLQNCHDKLPVKKIE